MKIIYKKKMKSSSLTLKKEKLLAQQPAEYQGDEKGRIFFFYGLWRHLEDGGGEVREGGSSAASYPCSNFHACMGFLGR